MLYTPPIYKKNYLLIANYFDNHLYKYLKSQHCLITRKNKLQRPAQEGLRMYILERRVLAFRLKHRKNIATDIRAGEGISYKDNLKIPLRPPWLN